MVISQIVLGGRNYSYPIFQMGKLRRKRNYDLPTVLSLCAEFLWRCPLPQACPRDRAALPRAPVSCSRRAVYSPLCRQRRTSRRKHQPLFPGRPPSWWLWWWMWKVRGMAVLVLRPVCLSLLGRFSARPLRWWDWGTDVGAWSHHRSCWLPWWPVSSSWASTTGSPAPGAWISRCPLGPVCVDVTVFRAAGAGFWGARGLSAPEALCIVMHVPQGPPPSPRPDSTPALL